jgi:hypothetical protein
MNGRLRHQWRPFRFEAGRPDNLDQVMQQVREMKSNSISD